MFKLLSVLVVILVLGIPAWLRAGDEFFTERDGALSHSQRLEPTWQLSFGMAFRTDESGVVEAPQSPQLNLYFFPIDQVALTINGSYTGATTVTDYSSYRSIVTYGVGVRMQGAVRRLTPYFEIGIASTHYAAYPSDLGMSETRGGFRLGAGISLNLGQHGYLDIGISQIANYTRENFIVSPATLPDFDFQRYDGCDFCPWPVLGFGRANSSSVYNPTTVSFLYRFGL